MKYPTQSALCLIAVVLTFPGCSSQPLDRDQALKNVKSEAQEVGQALIQEDYERLVDLSHPRLLQMAGSRAKLMHRLKGMVLDMKARGYTMKKMSFSDPIDLAYASGEVYAIVPFKIDIATPLNVLATQPSYLIAMSNDLGVKWKFIDGSGIAGDREKLKQIVPNFPNNLDLPQREEPTRKQM